MSDLDHGPLLWALRALPGPPPEVPDDRWPSILALARWQGVEQLLWAAHREHGDGSSPSWVDEHLHAVVRDTTVANIQVLRELDAVLDALRAEGIDVLPLKGAALVETVYAHPGLRAMADLDLLVRPAEIGRAQATVERLGYRPRLTRSGRDEERRLRGSNHHYPLFRVGGGAVIELHHRPLLLAKAEDRGIWDRAVDGPRGARLPAPEDLIVQVAGHFALDRWLGRRGALRQLSDLELIARRWPIDWGAVAGRSSALGVADQVFLGLFAGSRLLGTAVPAAVLDGLRPLGFDRRVARLFLTRRVLTAGPVLSLNRVANGIRNLRHDHGALEVFIDPHTEEQPSVAVLRRRHASARLRGFVSQVPRPRSLPAEVLLSRRLRRSFQGASDHHL